MSNKQPKRFIRFSRYASNDNRPKIDILKILSLSSIWICIIIGLFLWFKALLPANAISTNAPERAVHHEL